MSTRAASAPPQSTKLTKKRAKVKRKVPKSAKSGKEIKRARKNRQIPDEARKRALADPDRMWRLRMKFVEQAKKYFGIPYARKYWKPEDPEHKSKIFLDCCGLVRRVMRDLQKDFGFRIGPWNQAYQHDTLPIEMREEDMKPGDLVFISAIYRNPKTKKQRHNLTHVEIWLGDGPKTIGARWQKGKVQVFDSYRFAATSYHSEKYIFKSLDTWLMGICRSHCPEHTWKMRSEKYTPDKKSIFRVPEKKLEPAAPTPAEEEPDESAGDTDDDLVTEPDSDMGVRPADELIKEVMQGTGESMADTESRVMDEIEERFGYRDPDQPDSDSEIDGEEDDDDDEFDEDEEDAGETVVLSVQDIESDLDSDSINANSRLHQTRPGGGEAGDTSSSSSAKTLLSYNQSDWKPLASRQQDSGKGSMDQSSRTSSASSSFSFSSGIVTDMKNCSISDTKRPRRSSANVNNSSNDSDDTDRKEEPASSSKPVGACGYVMQSKLISMPSSERTVQQQPAAEESDSSGGDESEQPSSDSGARR